MILGLSGKALSGKDTIADYMIRDRGWDTKIGFATNLKKACMEIFSLSETQVMTQDGKSSKLPRKIKVDLNILQDIIFWMCFTHKVRVEDKDCSHLLGKTLTTPRDILQFVGTDVMRYYLPEYHYEVLFNSIDPDKKTIVTDVRFPNEASGILERKGLLVRVSRTNFLRSLSGAKINSQHSSELALDDWDLWSYKINNNTLSLNDLYNSVDVMLTLLGVG